MNLKEVLKTLIARFHQRKIDFALSGGLALSTMGIVRFTKDIDFVVPEESKETIHEIMTELGYEKQDFSTEEIVSYFSPLKVFGQVDFLLARRKYTKAMRILSLYKDRMDMGLVREYFRLFDKEALLDEWLDEVE